MDAQFVNHNGSIPDSDGNKLANAGEYISYKILIRNAGTAVRVGKCEREGRDNQRYGQDISRLT